MAHGVTSQWDDIQRNLGNFEQLEKEVTPEELVNAAIDVLETHDPLEHKDLDQLDELEDDIEDEILRKYRAARIAEMNEIANKPRFGNILEISKTNYVDEVNNAPADAWVIVYLYQDYITECQILTPILEHLANKFQNVKFVRIVATKCVENFRDADTPCMFIYKAGECKYNLLNCANSFGGRRMTWQSVEIALSKLDLWETDVIEPEDAKRFKMVMSGKRKKAHSSDESSSDDDREYVSNRINFNRRY